MNQHVNRLTIEFLPALIFSFRLVLDFNFVYVDLPILEADAEVVAIMAVEHRLDLARHSKLAEQLVCTLINLFLALKCFCFGLGGDCTLVKVFYLSRIVVDL